MVDENVFEEAVLEELPTEMIRMTPEEIELEKIKIQAQMELQRNKMELEKVKIQQETRLREVDLAIRGRKESHDSFEVTKQARLVPKFEEANVDGYFAHFERTALNLGWPKECWSMLLQTVLTGKAQRAYATLPTENCADYDLVKAAVLKSFELVPEAYRQKFRTQRKTENQSYVEFLREKENALDKWCDSKRIDGDAEKLRQLILAEEFLNCVPEEVRVHLSERKTDVTYEMAALADEYILTHRKTKEKPYTGSKVKFKAELRPKEENRRTFQSSSRKVVCYKCGKAGHIAIRCQLGKGPERNQTQSRKPQGAVTTPRGNQSYRPWTKRGVIRSPHGGPVEVSILRDTGASQSLLLRNKLPKKVIEATRETVMIEGIGGKRVKIPLCKITLKSQWKDGPIKVGVVDKLPMRGISLILGNEVKTKKCHPKKMAKISAINEERRMARMNSKHGKKLAKISAINEERKMARTNAQHGDKMAAEPRARYKRHSRSQSEKVERKEVNLPPLNKQEDKRTSRQKKDEGPTNIRNKVPNTFREDKRKIIKTDAMIKTQEDFFNKIFTSYFIARVRKGLLKVCVWEGADDRTELKYFDPKVMAVSVVSFSSPGLLNRRSWGPLCWVLAFFTSSYQHLLWTPTHQDLKAPSAWCGFPYHISSITLTVCNSTGSWLPSWLRYIIIQRPHDRPLDLWNRMFNRHQAEITVMQFTGHSLPVHQSMSVPWEFF